MQRIAFMMRIKDGHEEQYREYHRHVWPDMLAALQQAGCHNYSIYARGQDLFAYMEVNDFAQFLATMNANAANTRWQQMMSASMTSDIDPTTNFPFVLEEVFHLD